MRIETKDLSYVYSPKNKALAVHAIDKVSLTIEEGEFFGIIGQTGSGKSTFVQHLNALIRVQKKHGQITVGEFDLTCKKCNLKELRSKVGMVFQYPEYQLFAESVEEDVAFGLKNFFPKLSEEEKRQKVASALDLVGLDYEQIKDKSPFELSGGQKRRVAIAGVIVTRPEVLVLDEPVAGLDPQGKKDFINLLHKLHDDFVKTIIIVSHDMNIVSENCTKVAVFSDGKILRQGSPKEVFSNADVLLEKGLDLPLTASLTQSLGVEFDNDFTLDGFVDKVANMLGGKQ